MTEHRLLRFLLFAGVIASCPLWCAGDSPPYCQLDALNTETGHDAYTFLTKGGNRCEGVYRLKLSGGSQRLLLRSLTSARSDAPLRGLDKLEVSWPRLPSGTKLRISVLPLDSPILYRMDTEADGKTGDYQWSASIAQQWFSTYRNLGVTAFYVQDGKTVFVPCALGKPYTGAPEALRADLLSLEAVSQIEVYSRGCNISQDCDFPTAGAFVGALPARDRDGAFTIGFASPRSAGSDYYSLRFAATPSNAMSPPLAASIVLRASPGVSK